MAQAPEAVSPNDDSEPDQDQDGISDSEDKCPSEPERYNGVDDEDGCPDQGIFDQDFEGRDGAAEARRDIEQGKLTLKSYGLPIASTGMYAMLLRKRLNVRLDTVAGCMVSESLVEYVRNYNKVIISHLEAEHGEGIIDRIFEEATELYIARRESGRPQLQWHVEFDPKNASLGEKHPDGLDNHDLLELIAEVLDEQAQIDLVLVVGHAGDDEGTSKQKVDLSERRARSVAVFLDTQGIAPRRIKTLGLGDACPASSGDTEATGTLDRRVEIKLFSINGERTGVNFACEVALERGLVPEDLLE